MRVRSTLAVIVALWCCAGPVAAQADKLAMLKLSSWLPPQHPLNPSLLAWAESLKKASGNSIMATLFPEEKLGKAATHYDMVRAGVADFAYVNPADQPGRFPLVGGAALPFLFANGKGGSAAMDAWYRQYAEQEMKEVKFCFAFVHDPGTFHARRRISVPADLRGMRVRPATEPLSQLVAHLGGIPVQSTALEARNLVDRGEADAITFPWGSVPLFGIDTALRYHMDAPLYVTPFVWVMNRSRYESLAPTQKKAVDDHCTTEWAERVATPWAEFENAGRNRLTQSGHHVYPLTHRQLKAWREAAAPCEAQWSEAVRRAGQDPKRALESLRASLAKYKAAL